MSRPPLVPAACLLIAALAWAAPTAPGEPPMPVAPVAQQQPSPAAPAPVAPYPSAAEKQAILDDALAATRHIGGFEEVPGPLAARLTRHCLHLLKEVDRRDRAAGPAAPAPRP